MSDTTRPICAYDVFDDGRALAAADHGIAPVDGAAYRWMHFDLSEPGLASWCAANLPPMAARALLAAKTRPRVDGTEDGLVLTMRGINRNVGSERSDMVSLRLWVTPTLVVSVRRLRAFAMDDLREQMRAGNAPPTPVRLLARVSEGLVERIEEVSLSLEEDADRFEDTIYDNGGPLPADLPARRREVIKMRRHIGPLADALRDLAHLEHTIIPRPIKQRLRDTANRTKRSVEELSEVHERLTALSDHLELAQAARLERNGYRLSIIAAVFLPLGFLTGLFGVNVAGMPGLQSPMAFWWLTGAMVILAVLLAVLMRVLRWF